MSGFRGTIRDHMLMNSSLERVCAVQFGAVLAREGHAGQYVMLILIYQRGELGPPRAELVDDVSPGSVRCLSFGRQEGWPDCGGHHSVLALTHMRQRVPDPMHSIRVATSR